MSYLITQSLISSWNYLMSCREECQEEAYNDFLNALNRIPKETTPEMQNGIDFETSYMQSLTGLSNRGKSPPAKPRERWATRLFAKKLSFPNGSTVQKLLQRS